MCAEFVRHPLPPHSLAGHKLSHKSARRTKSLTAPADLVYAAFHAEGPPPARPLDEDLPGMGQFYCTVRRERAAAVTFLTATQFF